jgi:hypothetical protein
MVRVMRIRQPFAELILRAIRLGPDAKRENQLALWNHRSLDLLPNCPKICPKICLRRAHEKGRSHNSGSFGHLENRGDKI